eukprot:TRINITY_DN5229_c0_g1_i3.p1 TRINITY_DN5229_c0_g1~~TRINITY_DN5229_c0_g1_i3.p1  ORF type:complete len:263 (-),score=49.78 TRINITY_DN5229_c0_g1_i3:355-1143(-)
MCIRDRRGTVWPQLIGNQMQINRAYYDHLVQCYERDGIPKDAKHVIIEDINRTHPYLKLLEVKGISKEDLQHVLELFQYLRPDIGYIQGMNYLASILLFYMTPYKAFKYFTNLIVSSRFLTSLYRFDINKFNAYIRAFDYFLELRYKKMYDKLKSCGISSDIFLVEWFFTLFSRAFTLSTVVKLWDLFLYNGECILFKTALAVVGQAEEELLDKDSEDIIVYIRQCSYKVDQEKLLGTVLLDSSLGPKSLQETILKFRSKDN